MNLNNAKKSTKTGKNFRGGGENFSGLPEYIPLGFLSIMCCGLSAEK